MWFDFYEVSYKQVLDPNSEMRGDPDQKTPSPEKKMWFDPLTSEWRGNFPTLRYRNDI